jgi:RNA ligase
MDTLPMEKTLVLLVGAQGSGKSTYCQRHLADYFRISQDDQGKQAHHTILDGALHRGEPRIVVDRINNLKAQRKRYLEPARQFGYRTRIVWLNTDRSLCLKRCQERTDHPTLKPVEAEGALHHYFENFQTPSRREADELVILGPPPRWIPVVDLTGTIGARRHIVLGDVHGCFDEMIELLTQLDYQPGRDVLISVGDIVDRGPKIRETVEYLFGLPEFHMVLGNHEHKLERYLKNHAVKVASGLETTIQAYGDQFPPDLAERLAALPLILKTPSGYVVHAGFDPEMPPEEQSQADCLYMRYYGGKTYFDEINGRIWYDLWPKEYGRVFFGHIPDPDGPTREHVVSLDAGCVFGGALKAFDSRDGQVHAVKAKREYAVGKTTPIRHLSPLEQIKRREEHMVAGLLRGDRSDDGKLAIYTYTDACVYDNAWDDITRNSRGHIYNLDTGECVAYPFPKFFNLGENQQSLPELFPWDQPYEIYEKLDGWLGVLYRQDGRFKVATRGSFHSSGAVWGTAFIQQFDLRCLPDDVTLVFELIHPNHQIILDYQGQETLIILAAYNRQTGEEYPRPVVADWARQIGLPIVPVLGHLSLEDLKNSQVQQEQCEGFVIRFADGRRVKVKTDWYLQLAKLMANLSPIAVWETMKQGKVDVAYLKRLPEELRPVAERYQAILEGQYARVLLEIEQIARPILERFGNDRRALAEHVNQRKAELGYRKPAVFILMDGRPERLEKIIMDQIYPHANQFVADG